MATPPVFRESARPVDLVAADGWALRATIVRKAALAGKRERLERLEPDRLESAAEVARVEPAAAARHLPRFNT